MNSNWKRAMLTSLILIFSTLAGCLEGDTETPGSDNSTESLGTVMVSTYHIGELVKGIAGEQVVLEYMSQDNIPVHDYEPSASDLIRLQNADVFFYHGLGLEPWVESTLSSLGENAPTSIEVHTMPDGLDTLDYEGVLVTDLCKTLAGGPYENIELVDEEEHADDVEIHAEYTAFNMTFHHEEHDDHGEDEDHDEDEHDGHDEDSHDEHDEGHEGHAHLEAEETIANPEGCPADSIISIFHLEEGEYVLEFDAEHPEDFTMAVLKMGGGHAHHDHGGEHDDHADEDHGEEGHGVCHDIDDHTNKDIDNEADCEAAGHTWMEEEEHEGDYCHDTSSHANTNHTTEEECEAAGHMWMEEDGHNDHGDHEDEMTAEQAMAMFDTNNDSHITWDEFWVSWTTNDHDEDGHDEDGHDEDSSEQMEHMLMGMFNESDMDGDGLLNMSELEHFVEDIDSLEDMDGTEVFMMMYDTNNDDYLSWDEYMSMWNSAGDGHDEDGHDEHDEEYQLAILFPDNTSMMLENDHMENHSGWNMTNMTLQEKNISVNYSVDATYGTMLTGINGFDAPANFSWWWSLYLWNETTESWDESQIGIDSVVMGQDADHIAWAPSSADVSMLPVPEEHHDEEDHDESELMEEMMMAMLGMMFNESDMDGDGLLNESELEHFLSDMDDDDSHPAGYVTIHVEAEGDYGFALPTDVKFHILDNDGGHDDHAGHDDHDDHADEEGDDHADEEGDDHDEHEGEESLNFDPHSWLNPLAFKAQVSVVMDGLTTAFPDGEADFKSNAEAYSAQLTAIDAAFDAAFGENGVCMAGGHEKTVAANHNAYSYIAVEYGIQFMTVHGLDPEGEPSPEDVAKVVNFINEEGITVLFVEEYTDQSSIQSIVDETGVEIQILYTMEMAPSDSSDNYMTMMTKNLENLIAGIGC